MKLKRRVYQNKSNGQLLISIPKVADLKAGDIVLIDKVEEKSKSKE